MTNCKQGLRTAQPEAHQGGKGSGKGKQKPGQTRQTGQRKVRLREHQNVPPLFLRCIQAGQAHVSGAGSGLRVTKEALTFSTDRPRGTASILHRATLTASV